MNGTVATMDAPKPFASLSPSLLARKGGARPAMRPQYQAYAPAAPSLNAAVARDIHEDLGWNDMGHEPEQAPEPVAAKPVPAEVVALKPPAPVVRAPEVPAAPVAVEVPEVVRRQAEIADRIAEAAVQKAEDRPVEAGRRSALAAGRRAAFTLRLDAERHLKLRLACTIANRSAQQVVTDALDQFIANLPDVAELAAQVRKRG